VLVLGASTALAVTRTVTIWVQDMTCVGDGVSRAS